MDAAAQAPAGDIVWEYVNPFANTTGPVASKELAMCHRVALLIMIGIAGVAPHGVLAQTPDFSGNWMRAAGAPDGGRGRGAGVPPPAAGRGAAPSETVLTEAGRRKAEAYDFKKDDPSYKCVPASWARVWGNPNVVVRITQAPGEVRLQHEWMDIDRRVPLVDPAATGIRRAGVEKAPTLGRSAAWYDGDALVIDTVEYEPSYQSTISGAGQSQLMRTVERLTRSGDALTIEITHLDPVYFRRPLVTTVQYLRSKFELMEYGCTPEDASIVAPR